MPIISRRELTHSLIGSRMPNLAQQATDLIEAFIAWAFNDLDVTPASDTPSLPHLQLHHRPHGLTQKWCRDLTMVGVFRRTAGGHHAGGDKRNRRAGQCTANHGGVTGVPNCAVLDIVSRRLRS